MTPRRQWIRDFQPFKTPRFVEIGDGRLLEATGMCCVIVICSDGTQTTMQKGWYLPDLNCNLYSTTAAARNAAYQCLTDGAECWMLKDGKSDYHGCWTD